MIRAITTDDHPAVAAVAAATGLFESAQSEELTRMLVAHEAAGSASSELWLTDDDAGLQSIAYCAPERMTDGTWNLYLIAVRPESQRQGRGTSMLNYVISILSQRKVRILIVETSGTDDFDYVRTFYRNAGFVEEARIREFYAAGVDKVVYWKNLQPARV